MAETDTRATFCKLIAALDPRPIENMLPPAGTPDVEYVGGWAELKYINPQDWPVRPTTEVKIKHYTDEQREWLLRRTEAGEMCWLVVQSGKEWFFYNAYAAQDVGYLTYDEMVSRATHYFSNKPEPQEVVSILTSPRP